MQVTATSLHSFQLCDFYLQYFPKPLLIFLIKFEVKVRESNENQD